MEFINENLFKILDVCCLCGEELSHDVNVLKKHFNHHLDEAPFECFLCAELYDDLEMLLNHIYHLHNNTDIKDDEEETEIGIDNESSDNESTVDVLNTSPQVDTQIKTIIIKTSTDATPIRINVPPQAGKKECPTCNKTFTTASVLRKHFLIHTGEKPHQCNICGHCFTALSNLNAHMKLHSGERPHKCDSCSRTFSRASHLVEHTKTHSGERPFACNNCGKSFANKATLKKHIKIHLGLRSLQCTLCPRAFREQSDLNKHVRTHTSERIFSCSNCNAAFSRLDTLKKHQHKKRVCTKNAKGAEA